MKVCTFFICFISAASSDDQSLMQQGVGVEVAVLSENNANQWKSNFEKIRDVVEEIPQRGKMRQMAIDALMNTVAAKTAASPPDAAVITLLDQIVTLLWSIINGWQSEIEAEITDLNNKNDVLTACNNDGVTEDGTRENTKDTAQTTHYNCRIGPAYPSNTENSELDLRKIAETSCATLEARILQFIGACPTDGTAVMNLKPDTTLYPTNFGATVEEVFEQNGGTQKTNDPGGNVNHVSVDSAAWTTYLSAAETFWAGEKTNWDNLAPTCKTDADAWDTKRDQCDLDQQAYESAFCAHWEWREARCDTLDSCYLTGSNNFNWALGNYTAYDTTRKNIAKVIQRVVCLINVLKGGVSASASFDASSDACYTEVQNNESDIIAATSRTKPTIVAKDTCTDIAAPQPSETASWDSTYYQGIIDFFNAESFPDNDLDLTTTTRAACQYR